jgi:UDP-glucose 4-epimerase
MKNYIVVTGGAGFVGSNLIEYLLLKTNKKILSIDNYSSGFKKNHIVSPRLKYIKADTKDISKVLSKYKSQIISLFHFGEFSRIFQSFSKLDECLQSNTIGTYATFKFCLDNKIKLIYSATSATLGNEGEDKNLSPYAFTKAKNLELLNNLKNWFNFKFEIVYFYNVYGPGHIMSGDMATVIGIFENQYNNKKPLTVVKPGTQTRRFTHINDTINVCYEAWVKNKCAHYSITNKKFYTIKQVAKMFNSKIKLLKARPGERFTSSLTNKSLKNKIIRRYGKIHLKDYITSVIKG